MIENMDKVKSAETLVAVKREYLLENKINKKNIKNRGRTMPVKEVIGLSLCAFTKKVEHNHRRGGP